jgi:hypothetical protein
MIELTAFADGSGTGVVDSEGRNRTSVAAPRRAHTLMLLFVLFVLFVRSFVCLFVCVVVCLYV